MGMNGSAEAVAGRGTTTLAVGDRNGNVVLSFPHEVGFVALDPSTAVQVAKSMIDAAVKCGANVSIQAPPPKVPKLVRERMIARAHMILRNKRESAENDAVMSERIVDTLLNILAL
mgnify:CR=1 FL=1